MTDIYDHEDLYNAIVLGTARSPGVVKLSGHDREKQWDIQKAKGQTGATSQLQGDPIGQFTATFTLAEPEDFERWERFQFLLEQLTSGPKPIALPIYHPLLALNGFTEVSGAGIGGMVYDDLGRATVAVKFIEYRPPKPKPPKKAQAETGVRIGTTTVEKPDPNAAAKAELAALLEEARRP